MVSRYHGGDMRVHVPLALLLAVVLPVGVSAQKNKKVAAPADITRLVALAREQQRHYIALLVRNADGLRWVALSLD